jgi:hypothetical protein
VEETPPSKHSKLLGTVDQDCMLMSRPSRQLGARGAPRIGAIARDPHDDDRLVEPASQLFQERGLAAALGADDGNASAEIVHALHEAAPLQGRAPEGETLDAMAGEGVVGGSAGKPAFLTTSLLRPAIFRNLRRFLASGCSTYCQLRLRAL